MNKSKDTAVAVDRSSGRLFVVGGRWIFNSAVDSNLNDVHNSSHLCAEATLKMTVSTGATDCVIFIIGGCAVLWAIINFWIISTTPVKSASEDSKTEYCKLHFCCFPALCLIFESSGARSLCWRRL